MPISFSGGYTPADLRHALAIRRKALPNPQIMLFWLTTFSFVVIVLIGILLNPGRLWAALLFAAIWLSLHYFSSRLTPYLALEEWRGAPQLHTLREGTITEEGIEVHYAEGMSRLQWRGYAFQVVTPEMALLFQGVTTFHFFPRAFFSDERSWQAFTTLVQAQVADEPPPEWRPIFARLNTLWLFAFFLTLFVGLAVIFSL